MAKYSLLKIFTDGGSRGNPGTAGIGVHVVDDQDQTVFDYHEFVGITTNNVAEYRAVIAATKWLQDFSSQNEIEKVEFYLDSKLVVEQVKKNWKINESHLQDLAREVWQELKKLLVPYSFTHVRREMNKVADLLANQAMDAGQL
ncbi:ribonuclease HI family protein [Patescibacteria group bacterium]|nr:ribonuclease HI family protein [Patescibacteria group bacterium]